MNGSDAFEGNAIDDGDEFDDLIGLLREGPIDLTDEKPSPTVWAGISSELGFVSDSGQLAASAPLEESVLGNAAADNNVVSLASRRPAWGKPAAILTLAAAVVLLLAVPVALSLRSGDDSELIAAADLQLLDGQMGNNVAAELVSIDGDLVIDVEAPTEVADGEFLELWLLEVDETGAIATESLGRVDGSGRYDVPDDVDLDRFSVVDISVELDDGNDDHSGNSVVRGELS